MHLTTRPFNRLVSARPRRFDTLSRMKRFLSAIALLLSAVTGRARLDLPGENFQIEGRPAFIFLPPEAKRSTPQPWIFYAPTLPPYPDGGERWMHEKFLDAGIAVAGIDVGEAYGSRRSHEQFDAL